MKEKIEVKKHTKSERKIRRKKNYEENSPRCIQKQFS